MFVSLGKKPGQSKVSVFQTRRGGGGGLLKTNPPPPPPSGRKMFTRKRKITLKSEISHFQIEKIFLGYKKILIQLLVFRVVKMTTNQMSLQKTYIQKKSYRFLTKNTPPTPSWEMFEECSKSANRIEIERPYKRKTSTHKTS